MQEGIFRFPSEPHVKSFVYCYTYLGSEGWVGLDSLAAADTLLLLGWTCHGALRLSSKVATLAGEGHSSLGAFCVAHQAGACDTLRSQLLPCRGLQRSRSIAAEVSLQCTCDFLAGPGLEACRIPLLSCVWLGLI